jgi:(1->4)-alpha-D-glucan 1-alpha-D-glucosylmutase
MSAHLLAYVRQWGHEKIAVIVPRCWASIVPGFEPSPDPKVWDGTSISLPHGSWVNVITGKPLNITGDTPIADILAAFPFAVLRASGSKLEEAH